MNFYKSVKFRLTLWYTLVLTLFLLLFSYLMRIELERTLYRDADRTLATEAQKISDSMQDFLARDIPKMDISPESWYAGTHKPLLNAQRTILLDMLSAWEYATADYLTRNPLLIRIAGLDDTQLASNLKGWQKDIIFPSLERDSVFMEKGSSYQTIHFRGRPVRLYYATVFYENQPVFVLQTGTSLHEARNVLKRLTFVLSIMIPLAILIACLAGWFLAKRSFEPVDDMISQARSITAAYLKSRLPRSHAGDELDRLAETLNQMIDRIESSTRAVQEFSSDVSHELKTPLAIIKGEIDLALRRARSAEELIKTLNSIEGEVDELIRLVDDLMILVRNDAQQLKIQKVRVSLSDLFIAVMERFKKRAQDKQVQLSAGEIQQAHISGDAVYLKRIFSNLIDNAIKFTPAGGSVTADILTDGTTASIHVTDTGMGIHPDIQQKVFSRFYRSDEARSYEGAGLGLNIVKALCDAHGATVSIESKIGFGSKISVKFPLA